MATDTLPISPFSAGIAIDADPVAPSAPRAARARPSLPRRIYAAFIASRMRQAEREIARHLRARGLPPLDTRSR